MHVCVVGESHFGAQMGGAEYQSLLLTEELCRRDGVSVTYLARRVPSGSGALGLPYKLRRIGSDAGIRRRAVAFDAPELWRTLKELRPDVVYQQAKQSYTAVCAQYARRSGVPFFFHVASDADLDHRWISLKFTPNTPFDVVESLSGDWGIRHASDVIVQTDRQAAMLRERFGRTATAVIRNFQPLPASLPLKPAGPLKILWVANFKDVKRPELFVQLAESMAHRSDLQFQMVGSPAKQRRFAALMEKIPRVGNLTYFGSLPISEVNELMTRASFHINTSSFEGFPNTFIQAWARGAVVISLSADPFQQGMESLGIGFCAGTMERLRSIIDELANDSGRRQTIAQRAFDFARDNHGLADGSRLADLIVQAANDAKRSKGAA
jgi:hypothetical protein